jgi:hypothetical protein
MTRQQNTAPRQMNLFLSPPQRYRIDVLYVRSLDAAFFDNEKPRVLSSEIVEVSPYELTETLAKLSAGLPRAMERDSAYRLRAFDEKGQLCATI